VSIVVAEDSSFIRELILLALRKDGFEPAVACDGEQAIARVREHRPRLLILDAHMPNGDGYDVCRELALDPERPYVLMLTAAASQAERDAALAAGADEFMTKPFSPGELRSRVRELLAQPPG
jgi:DNA-binding response OmpR family regulator